MRALAVLLALAAPLLAQNEKAKAFNEAFSHLQVPENNELSEQMWDVIEHGWSGDHPDLDEVLAKNEEALSLAAMIAEPERASFLEGLTFSTDTPTRHHAQALRMTRLRVVLARRAAAHDLYDQAAEQCLLALSMGEALDHDRIAESRIMHAGISGFVDPCLADVVNSARISREEILKIATTLSGMRGREPAIADAIAADTEWEIRFVDGVFLDHDALARVLEHEKSQDLAVKLGYADDATCQAWRTQTTAMLTENGKKTEAATRPGHIADLAAVWKDSEASRTQPQGIPDVLFRFLAHDHQRTVEVLANHQAGLAVLATLVALRRYRDAKGDAPGVLSALVPEFLDEVPSDPFDGKPLRYSVECDRVRVWSVGKDLGDDGGTKPYDPKSDLAGTDIILELK